MYNNCAATIVAPTTPKLINVFVSPLPCIMTLVSLFYQCAGAIEIVDSVMDMYGNTTFSSNSAIESGGEEISKKCCTVLKSTSSRAHSTACRTATVLAKNRKH